MSYSITEFERLYTANVTRCMRLAVSLLGDEDDARDMVQDVFLKLWESEIDIQNPEAFIFRSVRNACLDRLKSMDIRQRIRQALPLQPISTEDDTAERHEDVRRAVDQLLSARERQIVSMIYEEGMTYKATAENLEVSVALVNKSLVNAMKTLRTHFKTQKK